MDGIKEAINQTYFSNKLWQYLVFFAIIIAAIIVGKIFYYISKTKLRKMALKSKTKLDDILIDILEEPLVLFIVTCGVWGGQKVLTLSPGAINIFKNIIFVLIAISITWFLVRLADMLLRHFVEPLVEKSESKLDDQVLPILMKSIRITIILLAIIVVLSNLGYDILSILAGLGIGGLALALAAQDAVKNVIGGFSIFWDKPFQIDEFVEISGKSGTVSEVGLRSTRLKTVGGTTCVLPNSKVADSILENFSTREFRRVVINIGLTYETSADKMEESFKVIESTIKAVGGIKEDDIMTRFVNFGAFSLDLEIVYWITDMSNWKMIIHNVNMGLKRNLDEAGIDMAFPTETHYVINSST
jgi:MscS family membrane protein